MPQAKRQRLPKCKKIARMGYLAHFKDKVMFVRAMCFALAFVLAACQSVQTDNVQLANLRVQIAQQYYQANELDATKRQLDMALAANPKSAAAWRLMAQVYQRVPDADAQQQARHFYQQAMRVDAQDMQTVYDYAMYLAQSGLDDEALVLFTKAGGAIGFDGRIAALENVAYLRYKAWQNTPSDDNKQLALAAFIRAIDAGSHNAMVLEKAKMLSD